MPLRVRTAEPPPAAVPAASLASAVRDSALPDPPKADAVHPAKTAAEAAQPALPVPMRQLRDADDWMALVADAGLKGPAKDLAAHASFVGLADGVLTLALPEGLEHLRSDALVGKLADAFGGPLGSVPRIVFAKIGDGSDTLHARSARARDARQASAEQEFQDNPTVRRYMQQFGAKLVPDSIRPADDH
jgi:DNA polymerase-3 subunit gamma/tau